MSKPLLLSSGQGKVQELVGTATGQVPLWTDTPTYEWGVGFPPSASTDFGMRFVGTPGTSTILAEFVPCRATTYTLTASQFWAKTKPTTTNTTILVKKNGALQTTITYATSATANATTGLYVGTASPTTAFSLNGTGDTLTIESDTTVDAGFSTPIITLSGTA